MPRDFFPRREADIVRFTANFSERINAAPGDYSIPPARAAAYAATQQAFADAYFVVQNPGTNSSAAVVLKDDARVELEAATRSLVKCVTGTETVTDPMRIAL